MKLMLNAMITFLLLSGCVTLQSGMELQASGVSCEPDPGHFQRDTKDKLDPNANRSVKEAKAFYTLDCPSIEDKPTLYVHNYFL